jgi:hypothetical protein
MAVLRADSAAVREGFVGGSAMPRVKIQDRKQRHPVTTDYGLNNPNCSANLAAGGDNVYVQASRKAGREFQDMIAQGDAISFVREILNVDLEGYPGSELILRCTYGMDLPEGKVTTYVEPNPSSASLKLEKVEMTWPEYYTLCTGNKAVFEPNRRKTQVDCCIGRRGAKTYSEAYIAIIEAVDARYRKYLKVDESAWVVFMATDKDQVKDIIQDRVAKLLLGSKIRKMVIGRPLSDRVTLDNGITLMSFPCTEKCARGHPIIHAALDEIAWFRVEGTRADTSISGSIRPGLMQFPGAILTKISTPAAKQGLFYEEIQAGAQIPGRFTMHCPSWVSAPKLYEQNPVWFEEFLRDKPEDFNREVRACFDEVIEGAVDPAMVDRAARLPGDVPYDPSMVYGSGIDASGLTGGNRTGHAIAYHDTKRDRFGVALVRGYTSKEQDTVIKDISNNCRRYRIVKVARDRYAGGWVDNAMRHEALQTELTGNLVELWTNVLSLLSADRLDLPNHPAVVQGLKRLQKSYTRTANAPTYFHPKDSDGRGHADECASIASAVWMAGKACYSSGSTTPADEESMKQIALEEAKYDPLTYGRCAT